MRQRSRQACLPCRRRKRKCDGKSPCDVCTGYGYDCEYDAAGQSTSSKRPLSTFEAPNQPPEKVTRVAHPLGNAGQNSDSPILPGVLEPSKPRYVGRHSSVAFPLYVGLEVQATKLPRLHSFAYHTGIREEPLCAVDHKLSGRIPWNIARSLVEVYTAIVHPIFGFLDLEHFGSRCEKHWHGQPQDLVFEATVCGVLGIASLFNGELDDETETWTIAHAKEILEDCVISRFPSLEQLAAWILRTIYVRCTGRPHVTWLCSCNIMHLVEATGLHHTSEFIMQTTGSVTPSDETLRTVNRTAQVAHCLHVLIAFEYGRSIMPITRHPPGSGDAPKTGGDLTLQFCNLVATVPVHNATDDQMTLRQGLLLALETITDREADHDFLLLTRADLALGIYRRLRVLNPEIKQGQNDRVIAAGTAALPAARRLCSQNQPWWNIVGTVFQFACALIVMDTPISCEKLLETMDTLGTIVGHLDTHLAKEALSTARLLVHASLNKKRNEADILERIVKKPAPGTAGGTELDSQYLAPLSPSSAGILPAGLDYLWTMDSQLPSN